MGPVTGARMPLLQQGDLFARRFEIDRPVGAGGRGTVYRARDQHSGDFVARKLLHGNAPGADDSERFVLEAQILAELQHPGIVGYVAHGQTQDGQRFFAIHRDLKPTRTRPHYGAAAGYSCRGEPGARSLAGQRACPAAWRCQPAHRGACRGRPSHRLSSVSDLAHRSSGALVATVPLLRKDIERGLSDRNLRPPTRIRSRRATSRV